VANTALADVPYGPKPVGCNEYEVLIGRGTGERGPYGIIVGDPLYAQIKRLLPSVRGYAVQYPAGMNAASVNAGRDDIVKRLTSQAKECPKQKFAMGVQPGRTHPAYGDEGDGDQEPGAA